MSVLFVVYGKKYIAPEEGIDLLACIQNLMDEDADVLFVEGYAQTLTLERDEQNGFYTTLFRLNDKNLHVDRFHILINKSDYPADDDEEGKARFVSWYHGELEYWIDLIDSPVGGEFYATESGTRVQVLNSSLPTGGFGKIHDLFTAHNRSHFSVVKD